MVPILNGHLVPLAGVAFLHGGEPGDRLRGRGQRGVCVDKTIVGFGLCSDDGILRQMVLEEAQESRRRCKDSRLLSGQIDVLNGHGLVQTPGKRAAGTAFVNIQQAGHLVRNFLLNARCIILGDLTGESKIVGVRIGLHLSVEGGHAVQACLVEDVALGGTQIVLCGLLHRLAGGLGCGTDKCGDNALFPVRDIVVQPLEQSRAVVIARNSDNRMDSVAMSSLEQRGVVIALPFFLGRSIGQQVRQQSCHRRSETMGHKNDLSAALLEVRQEAIVGLAVAGNVMAQGVVGAVVHGAAADLGEELTGALPYTGEWLERRRVGGDSGALGNMDGATGRHAKIRKAAVQEFLLLPIPQKSGNKDERIGVCFRHGRDLPERIYNQL